LKPNLPKTAACEAGKGARPRHRNIGSRRLVQALRSEMAQSLSGHSGSSSHAFDCLFRTGELQDDETVHWLPARFDFKARQVRIGIEAQQEALQRFAAAEGFELERVFIELETGKGSDALDRRPQLAAALAEARLKRCSIAVAKLDRLSWDVHFIAALWRTECRSWSWAWGRRRPIHPAPVRCRG
jgi:hypothetical protein